jgi:hypothetical protein
MEEDLAGQRSVCSIKITTSSAQLSRSLATSAWLILDFWPGYFPPSKPSQQDFGLWTHAVSSGIQVGGWQK